MAGPRSDFLDGVRDSVAAWPANVPFGIITGIAAVEVGFSGVQTVAMSGLVFAGAAQLAAIELVGRDAPLVIVVLTALVVNLRYVMYSASIAPYFRELSARWRAGLSLFLLDVTYALSIATFREREDVSRRWYYLGVAVPLWSVWTGSTAVGVLVGASVPESLGLDFAVPLLFLALLFPVLEDSATAVAGGIAGVAAVVGFDVPFNAGLVLGALVGIAAGFAFEEVAGVGMAADGEDEAETAGRADSGDEEVPD